VKNRFSIKDEEKKFEREEEGEEESEREAGAKKTEG
jgi:hypothetical protein